MKLIESKVEYLPQDEGLEGVYKQIERCGRVSYKSEDKITKDSAEPFVKRMIKSNHCYDGNTEVLTEKGWLKFSEYEGQKVAVINDDLSFKGFEKPRRIIKESYTGKFYKYPTLGIEVTDGHKMFGVFRESKNNFYNNSQYSLFECNTPYKDNNGRQKTLGERMFKTPTCCINPTEENLKFELLGFWLGDGCYLPETKNNITFHLKKSRKINYLKQLCQKLDYTFTEGKNNYYRVTKKGIGDEFCSNFYREGNKYIPPMYFPSVGAAYSIFKGLINSDGTIYGNGKGAFSNTSLPLIEWISSVGCLIGYNISEVGISRITMQGKPVYRVHILSAKYSINNDSRRSSSKVVITNKTQTSYCVTVSTGLIMVRGSNKVTTICGNCAVLEHGTVYLAIPITTNHAGFSEGHYRDNPYSKFNESQELCMKDEYGDECDCWCITTNYRVLQENNWPDDLQYLCSPTEFHEKRYTFKFTCSRAIANELIRHRVFSFTQESTRYCNYSKGKFNGKVSFIVPSWCNFTSAQIKEYEEGNIKHSKIKEFALLNGLREAEEAYIAMLSDDCTPQQARDVLPNATKTELIMTGFSSDWRYLLDLRLFGKTGSPHPDMVDLMKKLQKVAEEAGIWDDIMKYPSKFG